MAAGVRRIYGIVGDGLNPIVDAVRRTGGSGAGGIDWIHVRHEEAAAFADAQLTGELAVCAGSCGPGNLHLLNGLYDANRSGAPVLAIASHIPSTQIGTEYFRRWAGDAAYRPSTTPLSRGHWGSSPAGRGAGSRRDRACGRRGTTRARRWWTW